MTPLIDDVAINTRIDWKLRLQPISGGQRTEGIPGQSLNVNITGVYKPDDIVLSGILEATGADKDARSQALNALIRTWSKAKNDGVSRKVTVNGEEFEDCALRDFRPVGPMYPILASGVQKMAQRVEFRFRQGWRAP